MWGHPIFLLFIKFLLHRQLHLAASASSQICGCRCAPKAYLHVSCLANQRYPSMTALEREHVVGQRGWLKVGETGETCSTGQQMVVSVGPNNIVVVAHISYLYLALA